jgi:hypothetical protein
MNLLEDALVQYDELEASYTLSSRTSSLTWFKSLGGTSSGDECLSILDPNSKPFRKLIVQNEITIFDFRIYLFARQAALACALGRITELAKRATPFIHSMAKMLRARDVGFHDIAQSNRRRADQPGITYSGHSQAPLCRNMDL